MQKLVAAFAADTPSPCDNCELKDHCADNFLACRNFYYYGIVLTDYYGAKHNIDKIPTRYWYRKIYSDQPEIPPKHAAVLSKMIYDNNMDVRSACVTFGIIASDYIKLTEPFMNTEYLYSLLGNNRGVNYKAKKISEIIKRGIHKTSSELVNG